MFSSKYACTILHRQRFDMRTNYMILMIWDMIFDIGLLWKIYLHKLSRVFSFSFSNSGLRWLNIVYILHLHSTLQRNKVHKIIDELKTYKTITSREYSGCSVSACVLSCAQVCYLLVLNVPCRAKSVLSIHSMFRI